jgi:cyclopropane-fatty-acyl-phospholipid synthase
MPSRRARAARTIVDVLLGHVRGGVVEVHDAFGSARFGDLERHGTEPMSRVHVEVHDVRVYERALRQGSVGLGESYADGWWDTDDLAGFLRLALRALRSTHARRDRVHELASPIIDPISRVRRSDRRRDARHVRAHYDVGNDFFRRVLDETMAYSCAIFEAPEMTLAEASTAKFDRLARMLDLSPCDRVVEIGTGWGGFALHAAERYGCHVTTTTISQRQYEFARARVHASGLDDRVTVLDRDYREMTGTFDKAIAIEMIEAVDWRDYGTFFECMRGLLTDDGALAMQAIVAPDRSFDRLKRHRDFIKAAIFPGGCLPSIAALTAAAGRNGLALRDLDRIGGHYGETLRRWRTNLDQVAPELPNLGLDARFGRLWDFYFAYCEAGFDERYLDGVQLLYAPGPAPGPGLAHGSAAHRARERATS